jgi:sarcosine oxidase, subunit alpha
VSPALGHPIALALLTRGAARIGEHVRVYHLGNETLAQVVKTPFFDPEGRRLHG